MRVNTCSYEQERRKEWARRQEAHLLLVVKLQEICQARVSVASLLTGRTNADKAEGLAIIFSTMARVSPSRSLSFEFSGVIFVVSILGAVVTTCGHQTCWLSFSSETVTSRESSAVGPSQHYLIRRGLNCARGD